MPTKTWFGLLLSAIIILTFLGCGTGTPTVVHNAPAPATPANEVSLAFKVPPPTTVSVNGTAKFTAVVSNDSSNAGVDWRLLCSAVAPACGSLSLPHTASGTPVTYTPPASLTTNSQTYTIQAFATADRSKTLLTSIAVKGFAGALKGAYVLQTSGSFQNATSDDNGPFHLAGVVVLDGNGKVTGGEQTYSAYSILNGTAFTAFDAIAGGSYFIGPDGRGTLRINTNNVNVGQNGIEVFSLVVLSQSQAFIAKVPDPSLPGDVVESSTGTMDLQTGTAAPTAGYAFVVTGTDISTSSVGAPSPTGVGGVLNIDSPGNISGTGSISDQYLPVFALVTPSSPISGTVSVPDSLGAVQFNLSTFFSAAPMVLTGYIIDSTHIVLIETDVDTVNLTGAIASGTAIGQGAATGTFKQKAALAGNYQFGIFGQDAFGAPATLASAGTFTLSATGSMKPGFNEVYFGALGINIADQFHGPCKLDKTGTGRLDCFLTYKDPNNGTGPEFIFYLTGNGNPPLILDADSNLAGGSGVGSGYAYPVTQPVPFSGKYGIRFTESSFPTENDVSGQISVNGSSQTLAGTVDTNFGFTPSTPSAITGNFAPTSSTNFLTGTLSNEFMQTGGDIGVDYYLIDSGHGFFIENDFVDTFSLTFGYFSARTPVCSRCP
ncbi:MAG TPA: hypothetical protein VMT53_01755 [Terriglobales bacterium]|nr:hypothetical protein [Terriglobales bacterium]